MFNAISNPSKLEIPRTSSISNSVSPCPSPVPSSIFSTSSVFTSITDAATSVDSFCGSLPGTRARTLNTGDFDILSRLGSGVYGQVFHARDKLTGQDVALKVMEKIPVEDGQEIDQLEEQRIMRLLKGEGGVVQLLGSWHDDKDYYLAMELCKYGDLANAIENSPDGKLSVDHLQIYAAQLLLALESMHLKGVIHHDLKPENILINNAGNAVLTDFGFAEQLFGPDYQTTRECGSHSYMSPELLAGNTYSFEADLWALGAVIYQALTGKVAFDGEDIAEVAIAVLLNDIEFEDTVDATAQDFLRRVLNRDLAQRPTIVEMRSDPFFANVNWDLVASSPPPPSPSLLEASVLEIVDVVDFTPGTPYAPGCDPLPFFHFVSAELELPAPTPIFTSPPPSIDSTGSQSSPTKLLSLWNWIIVHIVVFSFDLLRVVVDATRRLFTLNGAPVGGPEDIESGAHTLKQMSARLCKSLQPSPFSPIPLRMTIINALGWVCGTDCGFWGRRVSFIKYCIKRVYGVRTREGQEATIA